MSNECRLVDVAGQTVAMGSRDQMLSFLKHHTSDGEYAIAGPGIDARFHRVSGVIYPCGGEIDGDVIPVRSREECVAVYGMFLTSNNEIAGEVMSDDDFMKEMEALCDEKEAPTSHQPPSKATVCERLSVAGIATMTVRYDGYGDDGCIEEISAVRSDGTEMELSGDAKELVERYVYARLPCGWEINEGSDGEVVFDVAAGTVAFVHNVREYTTRSWEE